MLHKSPRLLPGAVLVIAIAVWPMFTRAAAPKSNQSSQQAQQQFQQMQRQIQQQQQQMMRLIQQAQQQAQRQGQQMARNQARVARNTARNARNAPRPVLKNVIAEYEFVLADDALARSATITTTELDDKGRPKKLDAEEKKKLKGDTPEERKLSGYKMAVEDLQVGDEVMVTLSQYRPRKKKASPGEDSEKPKGKEKEAEAKEKDGDKKEKDADKPKEKEAEAKEKDGDKKEKAAKEKDSDTAKEGDENDDAHKLAHLKDWKPYTRLAGTIVEADMAGSRRVTIAIQGQQTVMVQPNRNGQNNNNNKNNNQNQNQNPKPTHTAIDPSTLQGTFVIVTKHTDKIGGFGGTAAKK